MGWVEKELREQQDSERGQSVQQAAAESSFQRRALETWMALVAGFKADVEEFRRITGRPQFDEQSRFQCRIANPQARMAVIVSVDLPQHAIRYSYEPQDANTAVPEEGVLTLRDSAGSVELYSADELLTSQQARRLVLEPLLFPGGQQESPAA